MYDNLLIVIVSGLINMGCFYLGMKAGSKEPIIESPMDIVEFDKAPEKPEKDEDMNVTIPG